MLKEIQIGDQLIKYQLYRRKRSKHLKITIRPDASVMVSIPSRVSLKTTERFIRKKANWILKKIKYYRSHPSNILFTHNPLKYQQEKEKARDFVTEKIKFFNQFYKFHYNQVMIRNQRTRWGSCSRKGNLSLNYKIIHLPKHLADYIIVHELCHLKEMNHSPKFWQLVSQMIPDYFQRKKELLKLKLVLK